MAAMSTAQGIGASERVAVYEIADDQLAVGSTLGGPGAVCIIKANGSIEKVYGIELGVMLTGTLILRHYDAVTGMVLGQDRVGTFRIHPEHQEHLFRLADGIEVHEDIFVLSGDPGEKREPDPPGVYYAVALHNTTETPMEIVTYAFCVLRGDTGHDIVAQYDKRLRALVVWNEGCPDQCRVFGCSDAPESVETTLDAAKAVAEHCPGELSGKTDAPFDPLGVLQHRHRIGPGETAQWWYLISLGEGRQEAAANYRACPAADEALQRTTGYYRDILGRSVVLTPSQDLNRGVLWSKANMLRVETKAQTGWCFVNDPTRSNNSVGRDTAWFGFGADYITPEFAREALLGYVERQEKSGMIVEYYDIRTGKTEDYGLNINDDTPLMIMALDLDNLKLMNDRFGHERGDEAIRAVGDVVRHVLRPYDQACRFGGDEFVLLLTGIAEVDAAYATGAITRRIEDAAAVRSRSLPFHISISMGVALWPDDGRSGAELMAVADARMYENKRSKKVDPSF
jgi:diguanylate cyclase (GGDEF)-like protein